MAQRDDTISLQVDAAVLAKQLEQLTELEQALRRDTALRPLLYTFVRGVQRLLTSYVDAYESAAAVSSVASSVASSAQTSADTQLLSVAIVVPSDQDSLQENGSALESATYTATIAWFIAQRVHWLVAPADLLTADVRQSQVSQGDTNQYVQTLTEYFDQHNPSQWPLHLVLYMPFAVPSHMSAATDAVGVLVVFADASNTPLIDTLPRSQHKVLELAINSLFHAFTSQLGQPAAAAVNDLEAIPDSYLGIDQHGRIQQFNQRAADMLGRPSDTLQGQRLGDLLPHFRSALETTLQQATSSDRVHRLEVRSPQDGCWYELYIRATKQGFQLYSRDVSDRKAIEDDLKRERADQRQLAEFRSKLIEFINQTLQISSQNDWYQQFLEKVLELVPYAQAGSLVVRRQLESATRFHYVAAVGYSLTGLQALTFSEADLLAYAADQPNVVQAWKAQFPELFKQQEALIVEATGDHRLADQRRRIAATLCVPVYAPPHFEPSLMGSFDGSFDGAIKSTSEPCAASTDRPIPVDGTVGTASNATPANNTPANTTPANAIPPNNTSHKLVAMLFIDNFNDNEVFDETVLELASAIASQMGVLIQRFELEHTLRQSEQRYRYIADVIAEIIYVYRRTADGSFVRQWGNWEKEARLTGYSHEEIDALGGWSGIVHPDDVNIHFMQKTRVQRGESSVSEYRIITKTGEERWIRDFCKVLVDENGMVIAQYGANQDITEQKRFELEREALLELNQKQRQIAEAQLAELRELHAANNRVATVLRNNEARYRKMAEENTHLLAIEKAQRRDLEARVNELAALNHLNRVVSTTADLDSTLEKVTQQVAQLFQATSCGIAELREAEGMLEVIAEYATDSNIASSIGARISISENVVNYDAIYEGQAAIIQSAQTNPHHSQAQVLMQQRNIHAVMIAPLRARDSIFGTIGVDSNDVNRVFSEQELRLLETVAGNIAGLIMSARLYSVQNEQFETLKKLKGQLERKNRELVYLSMRDALTGLYNRRYFDGVLVKAFAACQRHPNQLLSVVICDIDNFKKINDNFSHAIGDDVLRTIATLMLRSVRNVDTVARYGGEEFAMVLPQTSLESAKHVCERIRADIANYAWHKIQQGMQVTLSMGICADTSVSDHEKMLNIADHHLYRAKHGGKNRVCF